MRDSLAICSKRFHRRIHAEIAVRTIGVLPALVPVKRRFDPRIARAKKLQTLLNPCRFAHGARLCRRERELAGRPLRYHDGLVRIEPAHFLIGPVNKRWNIRVRLVLVLLPVNAEAEPIDVIRAGILGGSAVPGFVRIRIIVGVKHPFDI